MNLATAQKYALMLLDEYSTNGAIVPDASNQDYIYKMNLAANEAQQEIANIKPIAATMEIFQTGIDEDGYNEYDLPSLLREIRFVCFGTTLFNDYLVRDKTILIPEMYEGSFRIYYTSFPTEILESFPAGYEFEVDPYAQTIIPYKMAAACAAEENKKLYSQLMAEYRNKLMTLKQDANNAFTTIREVKGW